MDIDFSKLKILDSKILFKFCDETAGKQFKKTTDWGFEMKNMQEDVQTPKWGKVIKAGEKSNYKENDYILMKPLMWTESFSEDVEDKFWMTNDDQVMAASKTSPEGTI